MTPSLLRSLKKASTFLIHGRSVHHSGLWSGGLKDRLPFPFLIMTFLHTLQSFKSSVESYYDSLALHSQGDFKSYPSLCTFNGAFPLLVHHSHNSTTESYDGDRALYLYNARIKTINNILCCGQKFLSFACESCSNIKHYVSYCYNRFCENPACEKARELRSKLKLSGLMRYKKKYRYLKMITLNFPNIIPEEFTAEIRKDWEYKASQFMRFIMEKHNCQAAIRATELTETPSGINYHWHIIVDMPYVPQKVLINHWQRINNARYSCRINKQSTLWYAIKYVSKTHHLKPKTKLLLLNAMYRSRSYIVYGAFKPLINLSKNYLTCDVCGAFMYYIGTSERPEDLYNPTCNLFTYHTHIPPPSDFCSIEAPKICIVI